MICKKKQIQREKKRDLMGTERLMMKLRKKDLKTLLYRKSASIHIVQE